MSEYWLKVLMASDVVGEHITTKDESLLKHLKRIEGYKSENGSQLKITFHWTEN